MIDPPEKRWTYLRRQAQRRGIARWTGTNWSSTQGLEREDVETMLPLRFLAGYAARHHGMRIVAVESRGRFRRRWTLKPKGSRPL